MNTEDLNLPDESHPSARTVICSMDEVVGFSAVTGLPIFVESEIFKAVRIPALVSVDNQGYIQLVAFSDTEAASKQPTYDASDGGVPPWSINADAFLAMSVEEKRKSLRAYGGVKYVEGQFDDAWLLSVRRQASAATRRIQKSG
jgi:hypothetical protein